MGQVTDQDPQVGGVDNRVVSTGNYINLRYKAQNRKVDVKTKQGGLVMCVRT